MRTLCDVCEAAAAKVFCAADEAALCLACDEKVHGCNKLASRHVRLELAESRAVPKCDICESAPAFFYCAVDGTSLCLQCDLDVHIGGKKAHERYLLMAQRVELPQNQANQMDGLLAPGHTQANGLDKPRPPMNGQAANGAEAGAGGLANGKSVTDRHPPSSTAATAPGRESLVVAQDNAVRQRSAANVSDAPALAIAVGDEVEGGMAVERPAEGGRVSMMEDVVGGGGSKEEAGGSRFQGGGGSKEEAGGRGAAAGSLQSQGEDIPAGANSKLRELPEGNSSRVREAPAGNSSRVRDMLEDEEDLLPGIDLNTQPVRSPVVTQSEQESMDQGPNQIQGWP